MRTIRADARSEEAAEATEDVTVPGAAGLPADRWCVCGVCYA